MTIEETFNLGVQHHQAGRASAAEAIYRQILAERPNHPESLNMLGVLAGQAGKMDQAGNFFRQASAADPNRAEFHGNLASVLAAQGHTMAAAQCMVRAVTLQPQMWEYHFRLGTLMLQLNRLDDAGNCFEMAANFPGSISAVHNSAGVVWRNKGDFNRAIGWYAQALLIDPRNYEAASNIAESLYQKGDIDQSIEIGRRALAIKGEHIEALDHLGNALRRAGRPREALEHYQKAAQFRPEIAQTYDNMGNAYLALGEFDDAAEQYRRAIELAPDYATPRWNLSMVHLRNGDFERGWELYDWRLRMPGMEITAGLAGVPWTGNNLNGAELLVVAEQGLGDTIHFIRYAPLAKNRGVRIILACQRELVSLLSRAPGVDQAIARDGPLPTTVAAHVPLLSLPRILGATLSNIPVQSPYLSADPALKEKWRPRLEAAAEAKPAASGRPRVGLAWAGNSRHRENHARSISLASLAPLFEARPDAAFFSLQVAESAYECAFAPKGCDLIDLGKNITSFDDTAAIIDQLDLIISVDTAVAHLAGALGKPVFTLLPFIADWRWLRDRNDTPWYPTMRLFRQKQAGDWDAPIRKAAEALREF